MRFTLHWKLLGLWILAAFLALAVGFSARVQAQTPAQTATATLPALPDTGCCGPVTEGARRMLEVLDAMDVEHHWLANRRVHWESGDDNGPVHISDKPDTHCSAFAAAAGKRLGVYMLRPPDHSQNFLASAQGRWFTGEEAKDMGWVRVTSARDAQRLANRGQLVVIDFINSVPNEHGHIALVRPMVKSEAALAQDGPETMQAAGINFADGTAKRSFHAHPGAWPDHVLIYAHATKYSGPTQDSISSY